MDLLTSLGRVLVLPVEPLDAWRGLTGHVAPHDDNIITTLRLPVTGVIPLDGEARPVGIDHLHGNVVILRHHQGVVEPPNLNHVHSEIVSVLSLPLVSKLFSLNREILSTHSYQFEDKEAPINKLGGSRS
ncbi:hypothetical protein DPMN_149981 [Dreissena polymorpha]|uniref:Uncharacterized protein n=1 Tax=Dreissena polymorpha TaxID=45954 RepID=A0A9D4J5I1_DREPO|nr:hypothetical protein DPMN_149981 [Dreissena polymorpha]